MKVVWLIGAPPSFIEKVKTSFAHERFQKSYLIREANKIEEIPDLHLTHAASVFFVDVLNPNTLGFHGVENLRNLGCRSPVFLVGEPAAASLEEAFVKHEISGFYPTWEKIDLGLMAGSVHSLFHLEQEINVETFLAHPGRATRENIASGDAFVQFSNKLGQFVQRFGIESNALKKFLMGLCLPHVRQEGGAQVVEAPFSIQYGVDQEKFVACVKSFSRGHEVKKLMSGFGQSVSAARHGQAQESLFQEFYHVAKTCMNLQVFCGNQGKEVEDAEPLFVMGVLGFPAAAAKKSLTQVALIRAKHRLEMNQEEAELPLKTPTNPQPIVTPAEVATPKVSRSLQEEQLLSLLSQAGPVVTAPKAEHATVAEKAVHQEYLSTAPASAEVQNQLDELRALNRALADDVKRLMKERREPTGEKELKDALEDAKKKNRQLQQEMLKLEDAIKEKDGQIEFLREELKLKKVA